MAAAAVVVAVAERGTSQGRGSYGRHQSSERGGGSADRGGGAGGGRGEEEAPTRKLGGQWSLVKWS